MATNAPLTVLLGWKWGRGGANEKTYLGLLQTEKCCTNEKVFLHTHLQKFEHIFHTGVFLGNSSLFGVWEFLKIFCPSENNSAVQQAELAQEAEATAKVSSQASF